MAGKLVLKKKLVLDSIPYISRNLPQDAEIGVIREDLPIFRAALPDFWGGESQATSYPLVVPILSKPGGTQYPRRKLSKDWMLFVRSINNHPPASFQGGDAVNVIFKADAGWINGRTTEGQQIDPWNLENLSEDDMPKPDFIVTSGTVVRILDRYRDHVRIDAFDVSDSPPPAGVEHSNAATRIAHMMAGHKDGYYVLVSSGSRLNQGQNIYYPIIAPGEAWIAQKDRFCDNRIEFLPKTPCIVRTNASLAVRPEPSVMGDAIKYLSPGVTVRVTKYYPTTTGIWGFMGDGWIVLQYLPYKGWNTAKYFTDWRLSGMPAIRPLIS